MKLEEDLSALPVGNIIDEGKTWLIKNVVGLGEFSQNLGPNQKPRRYLKSTMEAACAKFKNLAFNVDHPDPDAKGRRSVLTRAGMLINPHVVQEQDGCKIRGDLRLIKVPISDHIVQQV